jgi:hypothetical protein
VYDRVTVRGPSLSAFVFPTLILLCSCTNAYEFTLKNAETLQVGQPKSTEYVALFGKPRSATTRTTADGTFETFTFWQVVSGFTRTCVRFQTLEFRNGVFNAYWSGSSCDEDRTTADMGRAAKVKASAGVLSRDDVRRLLGKPSGKARCPTEIGGYEKYCDQAAEVWAWVTPEEMPAWGFPEMRTAIVVVSFDANGKIADVWSEERQRPSR